MQVVEHRVHVVRDWFGVAAGLVGGLGVFEEVAGRQADDALVVADDAGAPELLQAGEARGGGRLDADALAGEVTLCRGDRPVLDGSVASPQKGYVSNYFTPKSFNVFLLR